MLFCFKTIYHLFKDTRPVQDSKTNMVCKEQQFLSAVKDVRKKFAPETARHIAEVCMNHFPSPYFESSATEYGLNANLRGV